MKSDCLPAHFFDLLLSFESALEAVKVYHRYLPIATYYCLFFLTFNSTISKTQAASQGNVG